ncbi:MAG: hypothetical protein SH820_07690 [Xanthomonadales bacterium]|nr:hypothetical protein [Xanthomonadales bacterium]
MTNIQQRIAKLLSKPSALTHSDCEDQIRAAGNRIEEIRTRVGLIDNDTNASGRWPAERQRIAEVGSPQELIALDQELELLGAEENSLVAQRDALRKRSAAAQAEESLDRTAAALLKLPKALEATERALEASAAAVHGLTLLKEEISAQRAIGIQGGLDSPTMPPDQFDRLAACLGWLDHKIGNITYPENIAKMVRHQRNALVNDGEKHAPTMLDSGQRTNRLLG